MYTGLCLLSQVTSTSLGLIIVTFPSLSNSINAGSSTNPVPSGSLDVPFIVFAFLIAASMAFLSASVSFLGSRTSVFWGVANLTVVVSHDTNLFFSFTETPTI